MSVGYHNQSYNDPSLEGISGWALGAGLQWNATALTTVSLSITSSIQPTTYEYSSGYFMRLYSVRVGHALTRNLQLSGQLSYRTSDYQLNADAPENARSNDKSWQAGLGVNYFVNRHVFFSASYNHSRLISDQPLDDYDENSFWLTLSLEH